MARYSEASEAVARSVVERLISVEPADFDVPDGIALPDLELDASDFTFELDLLGTYALDAPAMFLDDDGPIPVALSLILPTPWGGMDGSGLRDWAGTREFADWADHVVPLLAPGRELPSGVERVPREKARAGFLRRATAFLATRIAAVHEFGSLDWATSTLSVPRRLGAERVVVPGCDFSVSTDRYGLRVLYSGAYRIAGNYFGHPTSPVSRTLQAGDYRFGVDGGPYGNDAQWDRNGVVTLPGPPSMHLNY
jgi:hypothetical protein